jgi:hypothetical protein
MALLGSNNLEVVIDTKGNLKGLDKVKSGLGDVKGNLRKGMVTMAKWGAAAVAATGVAAGKRPLRNREPGASPGQSGAN